MTVVMDAVSFGYPHQQELLHTINLTVQPGEILGIRGKSGCGKSTLLKLLAGFLSPTSGGITWDGKSRPAPGSVGMVFQDGLGSLDPRWTVGRSVAEPLRGMRRAARTRKVTEALQAAGLDGLDQDALPGQLSGGQCQRIALARIWAGRPGLLLADEPTSALDASVGAGIIRLLRELADAQMAVIMVSHDPAVLGVLADRVLTFVGTGLDGGG